MTLLVFLVVKRIKANLIEQILCFLLFLCHVLRMTWMTLGIFYVCRGGGVACEGKLWVEVGKKTLKLKKFQSKLGNGKFLIFSLSEVSLNDPKV